MRVCGTPALPAPTPAMVGKSQIVRRCELAVGRVAAHGALVLLHAPHTTSQFVRQPNFHMAAQFRAPADFRAVAVLVSSRGRGNGHISGRSPVSGRGEAEAARHMLCADAFLGY